jgi:hypothetical protein
VYKDKEKKFDLRVVEKNIERGIITRQEYEAHLQALPDAAGKVSDGYEPRFSSSRHEPTKAPGSGSPTHEA